MSIISILLEIQRIVYILLYVLNDNIFFVVFTECVKNQRNIHNLGDNITCDEWDRVRD